jgi:hypothetical protein
VVSGIIGGIAGPFAGGPFAGDIKSWSSSSASMSREDLVDVGLKMKRIRVILDGPRGGHIPDFTASI